MGELATNTKSQSPQRESLLEGWRAFHKYQVSHNLCKQRGCFRVNRDPPLLAQRSQTEQPKIKVVLQTKSLSFNEEQFLVELCFISKKKIILFWPINLLNPINSINPISRINQIIGLYWIIGFYQINRFSLDLLLHYQYYQMTKKIRLRAWSSVCLRFFNGPTGRPQR